MDNLKVHHANKVSEWVEKHKDRIELFYLPPYAPEYNPDEPLNSDVKRNAGAETSPRSQSLFSITKCGVLRQIFHQTRRFCRRNPGAKRRGIAENVAHRPCAARY